MKFPQIGEVLPNGHTVLAAYAVGQDRYVLAHRDGAPQPYAVWDVDQDGDTRNGHYFEKLDYAKKYFLRCQYGDEEVYGRAKISECSMQSRAKTKAMVALTPDIQTAMNKKSGSNECLEYVVIIFVSLIASVLTNLLIRR